jgi:hypothetical protein
MYETAIASRFVSMIKWITDELGKAWQSLVKAW